MARRLLIVFSLALLASAPAGAGTIYEKKRSVDAQIEEVREKLEQTRQRERALKEQIARVSGQIRDLGRRVGDVSTQLPPLERELELRELKLNRLNALFQVQTDRLHFLRRQYATAVARLNARIVAIYESGDTEPLAVVFSAQGFADFLDALDYLRQIGDQDKRIADEVGEAKVGMQRARERTKVLRKVVLAEAQVYALRVRQVRALRDELVASHSELTSARAQKRRSLASLSAEEREAALEMDALAKVSASLAAKIRAAQAAQPVVGAPSAAGFVWPVHGPVASAFGWRWGRMHEGIDIGAAQGTLIVAVASGVVIFSGWLGGYGNLVVLDHGGGLATAYAHQSQIAVSHGQVVAQGQVLGYVGDTGYSFGPHLHFEVRVNGQAVDPLGYL